MSSREVKVDDDDIFTEQHININDLALAIMNNPKLSVLEGRFRAASVVALMIYLGGDTTSYLYIPYHKALDWYLEYVAYVGSLVRDPTDEEVIQGFKKDNLDDDAMVRLTMMLYALLNRTKVLDNWTKLPLNEKIDKLNDMTFEHVQKLVARANIPRLHKYMPSMSNLLCHLKRVRLRLHTWQHALEGVVPDVKLVGFVVVVADRNGTELKYVEPTLEEYDAKIVDGCKFKSVDVIYDEINTRHTVLFGKDASALDIINGAIGSAARVVRKVRVRELRDARTRLSSDPVRGLTCANKKQIILGFHEQHADYTAEYMKLVRERMGGDTAVELTVEYDLIMMSLDGAELPWIEMGWTDPADDVTESNAGHDGIGGNMLSPTGDNSSREDENDEDMGQNELDGFSTSADEEEDEDDSLYANEEVEALENALNRYDDGEELVRYFEDLDADDDVRDHMITTINDNWSD